MTAHDRLEVCKSCEWYRSVISQCKKCRCIMKVKVHLKDAKCPLEKWT